ncbi:MAG: PilZ domain-containing protein [Gammaproteobacteria bacterium]|nr:PilZ domain-containing protein [Gammaproteobacteria bacterium]
MDTHAGSMRKNIINLSLGDKESLYKSYLPSIRNGGIFVETDKRYELGDEVFLLLSLLDEADKIPVAGNIVWITPQGAQNGKPVGIGIQFKDSDKGATRKKIENLLTSMLGTDQLTHTL